MSLSTGIRRARLMTASTRYRAVVQPRRLSLPRLYQHRGVYRLPDVNDRGRTQAEFQ